MSCVFLHIITLLGLPYDFNVDQWLDSLQGWGPCLNCLENVCGSFKMIV